MKTYDQRRLSQNCRMRERVKTQKSLTIKGRTSMCKYDHTRSLEACRVYEEKVTKKEHGLARLHELIYQKVKLNKHRRTSSSYNVI